MNPIWDRDLLLKRVRGKPERMQKLMEMFLQELPKKLDSLRGAIKQKDDALVRDIAHSIKGSAANLSCLRLQALARELEQAAEAKQSLDAFGRELELEYQALIAEIESLRLDSQQP